MLRLAGFGVGGLAGGRWRCFVLRLGSLLVLWRSGLMLWLGLLMLLRLLALWLSLTLGSGSGGLLLCLRMGLLHRGMLLGRLAVLLHGLIVLLFHGLVMLLNHGLVMLLLHGLAVLLLHGLVMLLVRFVVLLHHGRVVLLLVWFIVLLHHGLVMLLNVGLAVHGGRGNGVHIAVGVEGPGYDEAGWPALVNGGELGAVGAGGVFVVKLGAHGRGMGLAEGG